LKVDDGDRLFSRTVFLLSRVSLLIGRCAGAGRCEVDPLDIADTSGLVRDLELKG
jgi:hypothetical protein